MPRSPRLTALAAIAALGAIALIAAGCGSVGTMSEKQPATAGNGGGGTMMDGSSMMSGGDAVTAQAPQTNPNLNANQTTGPATVDVALAKTSDYSLEPSVKEVPAGKVTFNVTNDGNMVHEMVAVKTDLTPKQLMQKDGTADESTSVGEAADIPAGGSKSVTLDLPPGKYVLLCNIPGHYKAGMYATFTAKDTAKPPTPINGTTDVSVALASSTPFSLVPTVGSVKAGPTRFVVSNYGTMTHEMVVVKTDKTPQQLMEPNGTANESTSVGEAADLAPGEIKEVTIDLKPGKYVLLCNLPGHYKAGMYHAFVVTP
ncbi:MAG: sulfocyanin-like copper-binding protein [Gaiellales bacterium]